ncbi:MAG TPA: CBS domain-containing protein [Sedimentisphaerales bacterium]|nr:CBS domain-containing protein [Sedimentisphaerales bacterium]
MLRAKDIMTRHTITVKKDTPIYDALELMVKHGISGMPIVEDDMTLVGILSEKDVIRLIYAKSDDDDMMVCDFMTEPAMHFDEDESLLDVCDFLTRNIFRRVPITSKGRLVGIISIRDTLKYILELKQESARTGQVRDAP